MDILKKIILAALFLGLFAIGKAQNKDVQNAFKESYAYETNGDYIKAIDILKTVYSEESYEINLRLGWLNYQAGMFIESMAQYQKAMQLMPFSEEAKMGFILPASAMGKWDAVINAYNKILENSPNNLNVNYKLGLLYYGQKKYEDSYKYLKKVVDLYPFGYDGLILFAWCNLQLGKLREAKILFQKTLLLSPYDKSALEGLTLIK